MNQNTWVTLNTFTWLQEASLLRARLESEGIEVFIPEEHTATINPMMMGMEIRLQIRGEDEARARELMQEWKESDPVPECDRCGGKVFVRKSTQRNWIRGLMGLLFFVPMRRQRSPEICKACGTELS